ncbi:MAG: hypothetical protein ACR2QJ_04365 [Geminicoccaceae bacterium]
MPNVDAGTYFLTILAPVKTGMIEESAGRHEGTWDAKFKGALEKTERQGIAGYKPENGAKVSWVQRLRAVLATLPTALQSPATIEIGVQSPFARNTRNHLCRFAIIEDVIYNGRTPGGSLLARIPIIGKYLGGDVNLLVAQKVDNLTRPYLMFASEVDAVTADGADLPAALSAEDQDRVRDSYFEKLWETAKEELRAIFENCIGFERVKDARSFAGYMAACQVETTMPFHDYGLDTGGLKTLPLLLFGAMAGLPALLFLFAALSWLFGCETLWLLGWSSGLTAVIAFLLTCLSLAVIYRWAMTNGNKPFPPASRSDLPSVLKALYLQQKFADFVIAHQGAAPAELHKAFGAFIESHKPGDKDGPTQKPGYISASEPGAVLHDGASA